jgi:hypothetical protein
MKNILKLFFLILTGSLLLQACKKDNGKDPQIFRIRAITPAPNDSVLTMAGPGQTIVIQGSGLFETQQIYFNGYLSSFNAALLADDNIVVTIPADMPFASLDQSKLNTIRVVTAHGEITYTFPIVPPPPYIDAMTNEMALAGERVTIYGNNFFFIDKVTFPGNIDVTSNITTNPSGTVLEVTVPAGVSATGGPLMVTNRYGVGTSFLLFNDVTTGAICNFDNVNTVNNWSGAIISNSSADFPGNWGNYCRLKYSGIAAGDAAWWQGGRSINIEQSMQWVPVANLGDPPANWAVKFEINTKEPWKGGMMLVDRNYGFNYQARYEPWVSAGGEYKSEGWKTVVIPMTNFKQNAGTGSGFTNLTTFLGADGKGGMNVFFVNNGSGATAIASFDVAVDNFRVARIK